jgi:hypothetical protein
MGIGHVQAMQLVSYINASNIFSFIHISPSGIHRKERPKEIQTGMAKVVLFVRGYNSLENLSLTSELVLRMSAERYRFSKRGRF